MMAHRRLLETVVDKETARKGSFGMFWHLGSLIRSGHLAKSVSPWITGKEAPRF